MSHMRGDNLDRGVRETTGKTCLGHQVQDGSSFLRFALDINQVVIIHWGIPKRFHG